MTLGNAIDMGTCRDFTQQDYTIVYVLGGPGSGKGTQCSKIAAQYGFCHLSVGELLQREVDSGSENKAMIEAYRIEGKLLPAAMVIKLIQQAIEKSEAKKFLIDGFPRDQENLDAAENIMKIEPEVVVVLECSKEVLINRLLSRNQGRADDNKVTIEKRLNLYYESTAPVIEYYRLKGKVCEVHGERSVEEVFQSIEEIFSRFDLAEN